MIICCDSKLYFSTKPWYFELEVDFRFSRVIMFHRSTIVMIVFSFRSVDD